MVEVVLIAVFYGARRADQTHFRWKGDFHEKTKPVWEQILIFIANSIIPSRPKELHKILFN